MSKKQLLGILILAINIIYLLFSPVIWHNYFILFKLPETVGYEITLFMSMLALFSFLLILGVELLNYKNHE